MAIDDEDVAQVRAATDLVALVGEYTPLKRVGRRFVGLCPFHSEKSASFSVNGEEGLYYCFGCQASGDAITFLRAIEGCDFVEAVERLAARAGITVRHTADGKGQHERDQQHELKEAMRRAVAFYHERLLSHADAAHARQYLRSRGYDGGTVRKFALGWSPERGSSLVRAIGLSAGVLTAAGLAHEGNYGLQDSFRGRVMFPIFDPSGNAIALGGRILPGAGSTPPGPKYRNSKETPIYSKRRTLYGLNWARQSIVQTGEIVVCEGYTDVIGLFTAGVPRAVATCGTSLTDEHFQLMARFGKRVVLAFDADAAGQAAASRFYEWERRHDLEVAVALLPSGSDPGEMAREDPDGLRAAVEGARPFLGFRVDRALTAGDLRTPEGRARAAEAAVAMIAEHPNELVRDQYLVTIADRTRIEVDRLRDRLEQAVRAVRDPRATGGGRAPHERGAPGRPGSDAPGEDDYDSYGDYGDNGDYEGHGGTNGRLGGTGDRSPEAWRSARGERPGSGRRGANRSGQRAGLQALTLAIHAPALMAGRLDESLFADPVQQEAYLALAGAASLHEAIENAGGQAADLLLQLAVGEPQSDPDHTIVALVRAAAARALVDLEAEARAADAAGDAARLGSVASGIAYLKTELEVIGDPGVNQTPPRPVIDAGDRLLGWLVGRRREGA
ncbi:MAG: DNA primase [Acidimicrobiales bacterium]|jgi:DNA primase